MRRISQNVTMEAADATVEYILAAFQNIVQENKLIFWATDIHYLTDKNEWEHAQNIYKDVCENLLKNGKIDQNIYKSIVNIKPDMETTFVTCSYDEQKNMDIISGTSKISAKFVICFSTENDSLPMSNIIPTELVIADATWAQFQTC